VTDPQGQAANSLREARKRDAGGSERQRMKTKSSEGGIRIVELTPCRNRKFNDGHYPELHWGILVASCRGPDFGRDKMF
jgi:hypothetical protein